MSILVGSMQVVFANFLLFFARTSGKSLPACRISTSVVPTAIFLGCLIKLHAATLKQMRRFEHHTMSSSRSFF